jgi:ribosome-associated heat shock protein Hsp15
VESTRIDRWLWAVRIYRSRTASTEACRGGHVSINGTTAKPSTIVRVGDRVRAYAGGVERTLEVATVIERRVAASIATRCVVDHTPPPPPAALASAFGVRDRSTGRPTKKERRALDRLRRD